MVRAKKRQNIPCGLYHLDSASHRSKVKASQAGRSPGSHFIRALFYLPRRQAPLSKEEPNLPVAKIYWGLVSAHRSGGCSGFSPLSLLSRQMAAPA